MHLDQCPLASYYKQQSHPCYINLNILGGIYTGFTVWNFNPYLRMSTTSKNINAKASHRTKYALMILEYKY